MTQEEEAELKNELAGYRTLTDALSATNARLNAARAAQVALLGKIRRELLNYADVLEKTAGNLKKAGASVPLQQTLRNVAFSIRRFLNNAYDIHVQMPKDLPGAANALFGARKDVSFEGVYGRIQFVTWDADYDVKVVDALEDLRVQIVDHFPDSPGKWQIVDHFPDYTIRIVEHFPDFTIRYVDCFPGT